ncbi:MAG: hypothetical protein N7Q72_05580 [Spiroplasma sp. Tabriz.8]|nr:hypothetical protein [Spiroplasma sp. Tabriz.8]
MNEFLGKKKVEHKIEDVKKKTMKKKKKKKKKKKTKEVWVRRSHYLDNEY